MKHPDGAGLWSEISISEQQVTEGRTTSSADLKERYGHGEQQTKKRAGSGDGRSTESFRSFPTYSVVIGVYADDVAEFARTNEDDDRRPLGERLREMAVDLDPVGEVRQVRDRIP